MKFANLHLHSTYSDAGFTPEQLVLIGKALGYGALALTDHETDAGCKEFKKAADLEGIKTLHGTEFTGAIDGNVPHLTALDFDPNNATIRAFIDERVRQENEWCRKVVERGLNLGFIEGITWDDVVYYSGEGAWLCADSIFLALQLKKAVPEHGLEWVRAKLFRDPEIRAAHPKNVPAEEVIKAVRAADGIVALAHPSPNFTDYIGKLVDMGLNGIETDHPEIAPDTVPLAVEAAKTFNLYHSGGTDHTGPMSCCGGEYAIPVFNGITEEQYQAIVDRKLG